MKLLIPIAIFLLLAPVALANESFINIIGDMKVEVTPNYISPILRQTFIASITFTDLNSNKELYIPYNVSIYNETAKIFEIDNLRTSQASVSSFSYVFEKEGNYFILVQTAQGQIDFPIFARTPNISGLIFVILIGFAALIGYFVGRVNLLKPLEEEIDVIEGKNKKRNKN
jgi:hypothetical protein